MTNWDVDRCKSTLYNFYMRADMATDDDKEACQWIAENADKFFDEVEGIKKKDGTLTGQEMQILFEANGKLLNDHFRKGIATKMHPVIEQMGLSTMQLGPVDRERFKGILNQTFMAFAPSWGVQVPPNAWGMQNVQQVQLHKGGMQPGVQINGGIPFGMNMQGKMAFGPGGTIQWG